VNHGAVHRWKLGCFCGSFRFFGLMEFNLHW
jgi:hypothetical protein